MNRAAITAAALGALAVPVLAQSARDEQPRETTARSEVRRTIVRQIQDGTPEQPGKPGGQPSRMTVQAVAPMKMEKGAYLGVSTTPAPQVLRKHLTLPAGVGLVVDVVAPDSPAAKAGLKSEDVLHKLNDQLLINPQQLAVLVRTFKPGDNVKLTVIREGKPVEMSAELIEKDVPPIDMIRVGMEPNLRPLNFIEGDVLEFVKPEFNRGVLRLPDNLLKEDIGVVWDDGKYQLNLSIKDGKRTLVAKDKDGKELFNGPIDTEEQKQALPPEVRERLDNLKAPGLLPGKLNETPTTKPAKRVDL